MVIKGFNERCWLLKGRRHCKWAYGQFIYESSGSPSSVHFDWKRVYKIKDDIIGFNHTHPGGLSVPSTLDDKTMAGWVKALGKPLVCGIKSDKQEFYVYERNPSDKYKIICRKVPFLLIGEYGHFVLIKMG